jgi:phosphoribosylanthranilate isomerase
LGRIKICGITNVDDALQAYEAGADALGFNFYPKSPRFIDLQTFRQMAEPLKLGWLLKPNRTVGVFVNEPNIGQLARQAEVDVLQLHGDESPEDVANLVQTCGAFNQKVWRAFRCKESDLTDVSSYLQQCAAAGHLPHGVLLDAYAPDAFGGTGKVVDWNAVREHRDQLHGLPVILAGGLNPDNVAEAIRTARPDAVDVASGVESSPGKKDPAKVRDFVAAATAAFKEIDGSKT